MFSGPAGSRLRYGGLFADDAHHHALAASMGVSGGRLVIRVDDRSAVYPVRIDPFIQLAKLTDSSSPEFGALGQSLALSGNTAVAGETATGNPDSGPTQAEVFVAPAGGWAAGATLAARLNAGGANDSFGTSVAISADQGTIVVGAPTTMVAANANQGVVYVFQRPGGGWSGTLTSTATLDSAAGAADDRLGRSVSISPDATIIAAGLPGGAGGKGAVFVFKRPGGGWSGTITAPTATLTDFAGAVGDELGNAVVTSGSTVVAGAPTANSFIGKALVYQMPGAGWSGAITAATATLFAGGGQGGDEFGSAVTISADSSTIAVGAPQRAGGAGGVYVYTRPGATWNTAQQNAFLTVTTAGAFPGLGASVAIDGNTIVAGAPNASINNQPGQGAAYVFAMPPSGWANAGPNAQLTASDGVAADALGMTVALSNGTAIVGDPSTPQLGTNFAAGALYAFGSVPTTSAGLSPASPTGHNGWYTVPVNVAVSATDLASPVAQTRCVLDPAGAPPSFGAIPAACPFAGAGAAVGTDGRHVLYMASVNQAGNQESPEALSFAIDRTPPTLSCVGTPEFALRGSGGLVSAAVADATSGPAAATVSVHVSASKFGRQKATLQGFDNAGNAATIQCAFVVTAPSLRPSPSATWNFNATSRYTSVLSLMLSSVPGKADVSSLCSGRGCPFRSHTSVPRPVTKCKGKGKHRKCTKHPPGTHSVNLTGLFAKHRLGLGTTLTVEIIQTNVVGKVYEFKVRKSRQPSVKITCLAPGSKTPGQGC